MARCIRGASQQVTAIGIAIFLQLQGSTKAVEFQLPIQGNVSTSSAAVDVTNSGDGSAAKFSTTEPRARSATVEIDSRTAGAGIQATSRGSGPSISAVATGVGPAAALQVDNANNAAPAARISTNGKGPAAAILLDNAESTLPALKIDNIGKGAGISISAPNGVAAELRGDVKITQGTVIIDDPGSNSLDVKREIRQLQEKIVAEGRQIEQLLALDVRFVHYRVDAAGNLTTGVGAELSGMNPARPLVIKGSENMFCGISKTYSNQRGDNANYNYLCEVSRNPQNLWAVTAAYMSVCRAACVGVELIRGSH